MDHMTRTREILGQLIGFPTVSADSNMALIEHLAGLLADAGARIEVFRDETGTKANLFATIGPDIDGGILLSGHSDVVPVADQDWTTDPWAMTEREGRLYGRGTCDMKGFIAASLALVPEFLATQRARPVHLAFSYDEEIGCAGAPVMINQLKAEGARFDGCVVGEPTSMQVVVAHKGINLYRCRVHGKAAHSSLTPRGSNAIEYAARLICRIRDIADHFKAHGPYDEFFDVPFTTMTTNQIQGGIAVNTIPELCEFAYEFRNLPGMSVDGIQAQVESYVRDELLPRMRAEFADARIEIETGASAPALEASEEAAITQLVRALTADQEKRKVAYGTEAGLFHNAGIPTVVCGPGSIEQAHKPNEFIALSQIGEYLVEATQERFQLEVAPDGSLWEPLAPETIRRKNGDTRILRQSSTLIDTILYDVSDNMLLVGSNMEYAATHQFGREADGIPAREWLGLTTGPWNDEVAIMDILYDHFNQDLPNR
mgnify:CR=1 FL=1